MFLVAIHSAILGFSSIAFSSSTYMQGYNTYLLVHIVILYRPVDRGVDGKALASLNNFLRRGVPRGVLVLHMTDLPIDPVYEPD